DLARRAELRTIDLWSRGRANDDFLSVRLGLGAAPSMVTAPVDDGGDDELREKVLDAVKGHDTLSGVPVTVDLSAVGVLAVHGNRDRVDDVAAALAMQLACLHSPEDLIIAAALGPDRPVASWMKWLPQTRSVTSPLGGRHLTTTLDGSRTLLSELIEVADLRVADDGPKHDRRWPWVVLVLDGDLAPDPTLVSQLLEKCPDAGISVVWLSTSEARVPRQAEAVVDCQLGRPGAGATLWYTDPEIAPQEVEL